MAADMRIILLEIGKLSSNFERLIIDVKATGEQVDNLRNQMVFVRRVLYVLGGVMAIGVYLLSCRVVRAGSGRA